jgi:hypothetical protein
MTQESERRRWPRRTIELLIRCRPATGGGPEGIYFTRNLSEGGLMFESPGLFNATTPVEVGWYAPVQGGGARIRRYLSLRARVAWAREMPDDHAAMHGNRYQVGLQFQRMNPDDRASVALSCRTSRAVG